jgi:hypothetical protein
MLQHRVGPPPPAFCDPCGNTVEEIFLSDGTWLARVISSLRYTIFGYRYYFLKEWYCIRRGRMT